ncbi:hypothetical protein CY35_17G068300 [Sphagnum magellanicum]|nr:hypothetical protein CY35_17G068300 [Sphagnum magellanicum]
MKEYTEYQEKEIIKSGINKLSAILQGDTLKAVVFDIDGTVADSFPLHFLAFQETLVEVCTIKFLTTIDSKTWLQVGYNGGEPITYEFFMSEMRGKLDTIIVQELMPWMDDAQHQQFLEEEAYRFQSLAATDLKPIQGFNRFVEWVKERGLKCAAVTEASHENATNILKILGVDDLFDILVIGNECENSDPYSIAFNKLGIEPNEAFVLQDSPAGLKASIPLPTTTTTSGLLTEHHPTPMMSNGVSLLIQDYDDPDFFKAIMLACAKSILLAWNPFSHMGDVVYFSKRRKQHK